MADRRKVRWIVAAFAAVTVAAGVIAFILTRGHPDLVQIELRAKPVATIRYHGANLGTTPTKLRIPRSKTAVSLEATFTLHKVNAMTGQKKTEVYKQTLAVVPDTAQTIDFDIANATKISVDGRAPAAATP